MNKDKKSDADLILRQKAEAIMERNTVKGKSQLSEADPIKLLHELEVSLIGPELQNGELFRAKALAAELATEKYAELNPIFLSSLPYPAMYIRRKDRVVLAANKIAADLGVEVGGHCWRGFMKTNFIPDKDRGILEKYPDIVPVELGIKCAFCLGDLCFSELPGQNIPEVHAFGQIWNTYWVRVSNDVFLHYAVNITAHKKSELALAESNERFQLLFNKIPLGYQSLDFDGNFIEVNQKWLDMLGYTSEEVIGKWFGDFLSPAYQDGFRERFPIFKDQGYIHSEFEMVHKNGIKLFIAFDGEIGYNLNGEFRQTHCILQDITERKRSEEALRESEEKYRFLFANNPQPMWIYDIETLTFIEVNEAAINHYGYSRAEFLSMTLKDIRPAEDIPSLLKNTELTGQNYMSAGEWRHIKKNGEIIYVEITSHSVISNDRNARHVLIHDITKSKKADEALRYEKYLLDTLLNNVPAHIYFKDDKSRFIRINKAQAELFGLSNPDEAVGKTDFDYFTGEHAQRAFGDEQEIIRTGQPISKEENETWPDHPDTWVSTTKLPMRDSDEKIIGTFGISGDITERKLVEEELRKSEKKYSNLNAMFRLLADNTDDFLWAKDVNSKFTFVNKTMCDRILIAKNIDEPIGKTDLYFALRQREAHPENAEWHTFGERCIDSDKATLRKGKSMQFDEYGNIKGKFLFLDVHKAPIRDEHGKVIGIVGTARDVTRQRQLEDEREKAVEALQKSEENLRKLNDEKDKFFSIIAHDLRAPFNGFLGLTEIMAEGMSRMTQEDIRKIALVMRNSATNLFRLLGNLLEWARIQRGLTTFTPGSFFLKPKIQESLAMVQDTADKKKITSSYEIPEDLMVFTDVNMFGVIIRNLVTNAVKFTPKGGSFTVSAKSVPNNSVEISVKDTGIGMDANMIDNLFRLDISTSRKGTEGESSTGLGLIICKDYIEKHGGKLSIESEEGKGSTFRFTLPESDQAGSPKAEA
jgi:PAS domain S-box-containing protein